jgi:hypothetical protein
MRKAVHLALDTGERSVPVTLAQVGGEWRCWVDPLGAMLGRGPSPLAAVLDLQSQVREAIMAAQAAREDSA